MSNKAKENILELRKIINRHDYLYNVKDNPEITDSEYDRLYKELQDLEEKYPEYSDPNSPTQRIGAEPLEGFGKVEHAVQMQSLQDVFNQEELIESLKRINSNAYGEVEYIVERKIDGLSVSLEYENGRFIRGSTRGDGFTGEDITANLKTIKSIPMILNEEIPFIEVRGEVFIGKEDFRKLNEEQIEREEPVFANPRNAAAGSVRQLNPQIAARRKLDIYIFNIQQIDGTQFSSHFDSLKYIEKLGFKVDRGYSLCRNINEVIEKVEKIGEERNKLDYEIDGAVIKVNNLEQRVLLGNTSKTPKWAVAYKYPAEQKETTIKKIYIKVGRTGVLTPNAEFDTISLAGSKVSRATLHNMDYINSKNIKTGSRVLVRKAGDIIPEVVQVVENSENGSEIPFRMPENCPECGSTVLREEDKAAYICTGIECPAKLYRNIVHFVSRDAMDIEGMGESIVEALLREKLIYNIADIYKLKEIREKVMLIDRMGEKSTDNLLNAIEKSKDRNLERLIYGLGIKHIGLGAAKTLAKHYNEIDKILSLSVDDFIDIPEFGEKMALSAYNFFKQEQNLHTINLLRDYGIRMSNTEEKQTDNRFDGVTFVLTGTLEMYPRSKAKIIIESYGGKVSGSVSKKTDYVLTGENPGSKYEKAKELKIKIINEKEFKEMI